MTTRAWGEEYRTTTVCVDSDNNGVLGGRFYNPYMKEGKPFRCLTQFLQEMDRTMDTMDFPRAYTTPRTFAPRTQAETQTAVQELRLGSLATFAVRILFRQNASWQGSVTWMEGKQEQSFRSALELIHLISSALNCQEASQTPKIISQ